MANEKDVKTPEAGDIVRYKRALYRVQRTEGTTCVLWNRSQTVVDVDLEDVQYIGLDTLTYFEKKKHPKEKGHSAADYISSINSSLYTPSESPPAKVHSIEVGDLILAHVRKLQNGEPDTKADELPKEDTLVIPKREGKW